MATYQGSCHCGAVKYQVNSLLTDAIECNCSMCSKKGTVLAMVPIENFKLVSGQEALVNYQFYKKVIDHTFCQHCGVTPFLTGKDSSGNWIKAVNVRCLDGFDFKTLRITQVDGKSF